MAKGFYAAFSEQMDRLQSSVENIYRAPEAEVDKTKTLSLPIDSLSPGSYQPRRFFQDAELEELADSIRQQGLIQPIVVRPKDGDTYEILAGERRWRACKLVGMDSIDAIVRDVDGQAALAMSLIENIQRENLSPIEEAEGYQRLIDDFGLKQSLVGQLVGKSRSRISRLLSLLGLPDSVKEMIATEALSGAHGIVLATSGLDEVLTERFARMAVERELSRDQLEKTIQKARAPKEGPKRKRGTDVPAPPWFSEFEGEIESLNGESGSHVSVSFNDKSQMGELTIPFNVDSLEDFEDATHHIVNSLRRIRRNRRAN